MIARGIRALLARDWATARLNKDLYWAERIARLGPSEGFRVAEELRRQALLMDPDWPSASHREADLMSHVRVAALLHRASPTRRA